MLKQVGHTVTNALYRVTNSLSRMWETCWRILLPATVIAVTVLNTHYYGAGTLSTRSPARYKTLSLGAVINTSWDVGNCRLNRHSAHYVTSCAGCVDTPLSQGAANMWTKQYCIICSPYLVYLLIASVQQRSATLCMRPAIVGDIYYKWTNTNASSWTLHNIATYQKK
jgi:hypothetical protein